MIATDAAVYESADLASRAGSIANTIRSYTRLAANWDYIIDISVEDTDYRLGIQTDISITLPEGDKVSEDTLYYRPSPITITGKRR